jgi:protein gp37
MGDNTAIEWTDGGGTWNPWMGCTKVSLGCARCYMYTAMRRYGRDPAVVVRSKTLFSVPLKWKEPRKIFTCSWSDWFHPAADVWRDEAWDVIRQTPRHTYQILTKRPELIPGRLPSDWGDGWANVWLGVSVESQGYVRRIDHLRRRPARVRFLSLEPLLGPLPNLDLTGIHWVIVGGESGPGFRPCDPAWVLSIRDQCVAAGVSFFFKQWGGRTAKAGGRELDGRTWDEFPGNK